MLKTFSAALLQATPITAPASRNATQYNYVFIHLVRTLSAALSQATPITAPATLVAA